MRERTLMRNGTIHPFGKIVRLALFGAGGLAFTGLPAAADNLFAIRHFAVGASPSTMVVADVNGDGRADLEVGYEAHPVPLFTHTRAGSPPTQTIAVGPGTGHAIAAADLDGDGRPDLVVTNASGNSVSVLLNQGNGTFYG